jgi:ArsR family transcriptional regulator
MAIIQEQMAASTPGGDETEGDPMRVVTVTREPMTMPAACCTLDISGAEQERLVTMFKALGNPTRFEIVKYLVTHPGCITGDIVNFLPLAQATVSQHLKVLRVAGWISGEIEGPATCYRPNEENIAWFREKVGEIF